MMAGAVLTQSERELARIGDKNFIAMKTAKGQLKEALLLNADLRAKMARMQKSIDALIDQRTTAEGQIKRLLDLQERTQAQLDASRESRARAVWAYRRMHQATKFWSGAHSRALDLLERTQAQLNTAIGQSHELGAALVVVDAARQSRGRLVRAYRKAMRQRDAASKLLEKWEDCGERAKVVNPDYAKAHWGCVDDLCDVLYPREGAK